MPKAMSTDPSTPELPTPAQFDEQFREHIRVGFNWKRFYDERWPIELVTLESIHDLKRCFMPWYIGTAGEEVAYDDEAAVPMNLLDVPKASAILNDERRADIQEYVKAFQEHPELLEFEVPTYALPNDECFVLDRNHRLSALTFVSTPFRVTLWNVRGPLESDCLLDLVHWLPVESPSDGDSPGASS